MNDNEKIEKKSKIGKIVGYSIGLGVSVLALFGLLFFTFFGIKSCKPVQNVEETTPVALRYDPKEAFSFGYNFEKKSFDWRTNSSGALDGLNYYQFGEELARVDEGWATGEEYELFIPLYNLGFTGTNLDGDWFQYPISDYNLEIYNESLVVRTRTGYGESYEGEFSLYLCRGETILLDILTFNYNYGTVNTYSYLDTDLQQIYFDVGGYVKPLYENLFLMFFDVYTSANTFNLTNFYMNNYLPTNNIARGYTSSDTSAIDYIIFKGLFESNGRFFNWIQLNFIDSAAYCNYYVNGEDGLPKSITQSNVFYFTNIDYYFYDESPVVAAVLPVGENGYPIVNSGVRWLSDYAEINVIFINSNFTVVVNDHGVLQGYEGLKLGGVDFTYVSENPYDNSNVYIDVFNLISYGFDSMVPILNFELFPGLLIGTMLFLPIIFLAIAFLLRLIHL